MTIFQKPNKKLVITLASALGVLVFRKKKFLGGLSNLIFITSLKQWSKAEYISGINKFRKVLGAAGIIAARTIAVYRRNKKR